MLWLGFNVIGIIFMVLCFLVGLIAVLPIPEKQESPGLGSGGKQ
jgi:hypothetical protein